MDGWTLLQDSPCTVTGSLRRRAPGPEEEMQVIPADKLLTPEQEQQQRLGQLQQRQG